MLASVTMCNDDSRNYNRKISDLGSLTLVCDVAIFIDFEQPMTQGTLLFDVEYLRNGIR